MNRPSLVASLCILVVGTLAVQVAGAPIKVFILAGQSNMVGVAPTQDLSEEMSAPFDPVLFFLNDRWGPLAPHGATFGPEISFGRAMAEAWPDEKIALIKYAYGGSSILAWDPYWTVDEAKLANDEPKGSLYRILMNSVGQAFRQQEEPMEIVGILWMQGESDSLFVEPSEQYFDNFREFIATLRRDLGDSNLPFIFGRISQANIWRYRAKVRAAQARTEQEIPLTKMVDTDQLGLLHDGIHYDAEGEIQLGQLFAEAFLDVYQNTKNIPQARRILPGVGSPLFHAYTSNDVFTDTRIVVTVPNDSGNAIEIRENIPPGWRAENLRPNPGTSKIENDTIVWEIPSTEGAAELVYDLIAEVGSSDGTLLSGTIKAGEQERPIAGISKLHSLSATETQAPLLPNTVTLDGRIDEQEWGGAYRFRFDRANKIAPGVAILGPLFPLEESNAVVHIFHNANHLCVAVDVTDPHLDFDSGRRERLLNADCVTLCVDSNLTRSRRSEYNESGFNAIVFGNGSYVSGYSKPTPEALSESSHYSSDGVLWNFGASVKTDGSGYIVEFAIDKNRLLDSPDRDLIGFDIMIHDAYGTRSLLSKWGWRFIDEETGVASSSTREERLWGTLQFLDRPLAEISGWAMY